MDLLKIMANVHVDASLTAPICFFETKIGDICLEKIDPEALYKKSLKAFKAALETKKMTTVHIASRKLFDIAWKFIKASKNGKVKIPNGCCNTKQCPLQLYYKCICDALIE